MPDQAPVTVLPIGTVDLAEVEAAVKRAAKNLGLAVEIGKPVTLPPGHYDASRSQSHAAKAIAAIPAINVPPPRPAPGTTADPKATRAATLSPMESWGSRTITPGAAPSPAARREGPAAPSGLSAPIRIGVTDADLYTERREFVFTYADPSGRRAIISTKRLKEAFWKRKSDPPRQQNRLVREIVGAVALAAGSAPCEDPNCAAFVASSPLDIDRKSDRLCPNCDRRVRGGTLKY